MSRFSSDVGGRGQTVRRGIGIFAIVSLIFTAAMSWQIWENVDAEYIMILQDPIDGDIHCYTNPGIKWQKFGKITYYPKRDYYPIERAIRFNEGGRADITGSMQFEYPFDCENLTEIHTKFGSHDAFKGQIVQTVVNKSVYASGPLMSSRESYSEKRNDLLAHIEDQITNGIYKTEQKDETQVDPVSGQKQRVTVASILKDENGVPLRQEAKVLQRFGVTPFNIEVKEILYEDKVRDQIAAQQDAIMQVQTARAQAKEAEQEAKTVVARGEAAAAKAKWEQEEKKARAVVLAQQEKEVAELAAQKKLEVQKLDRQAAAEYKIAVLDRAEADSTYKKKVFMADGALTERLKTTEKIHQAWAQAFANYDGQLVPTTMFGGQQNGSGNAAGTVDNFMKLFQVKVANDMSFDPTPRPAPNTKRSPQTQVGG